MGCQAAVYEYNRHKEEGMVPNDVFDLTKGQQRNPARIPVLLDTIKEIWKKNPDLRLGQLIFIALRLEKSADSLFNTEDGVLFQNLTNTFLDARSNDNQ